MTKDYRLTNPFEIEEQENRLKAQKSNLLVLSISQSNWWAIYAHTIKLAAYIDGFDLAFSHSAFAHFNQEDGQYWILDFTGKGMQKHLLSDKFRGFDGFVKTHITHIPATLENINKIETRLIGNTYSVPLAIKSELQFFPADEDFKTQFCSKSIADGLEIITGKDIITGHNASYNPTKLYYLLEGRLNISNKIRFPQCELPIN